MPGWASLTVNGRLRRIRIPTIDHLPNERSALNKLSEVGYAWIDMRNCHKFSNNSNEIIRRIVVRHSLVWKWRWVTPATCPYHANRPNANWVHTADPYTCQFTKSTTFPNGKAAMNSLFEKIDQLATTNRTREEVFNRTNRKVIVLFWSSSLEEKTFAEAGWSSGRDNHDTTVFFDLQKFSPIVQRWRRQGKSQAPCGEVTRSLGIEGLNFHNAGNDAFAEVAGMARFLAMTQDEYDSWTAGGSLSPVDLSWLNPRTLAFNQAQGVRAVERGRPARKQN
ncbi:hypothetical protein V8F20_001868 [Naviculisporaceae sp. PSN 640]